MNSNFLLQWFKQPRLFTEKEVEWLKSTIAKTPTFKPAHLALAVHQKISDPEHFEARHPLFHFHPVIFENLYRKASAIHQPLFQQDYFTTQGIAVDEQLAYEKPSPIAQPELKNEVKTELPPPPADVPEKTVPVTDLPNEEKDLMVVRSFGDWLKYFQTQKEKEREEEASKSAVKALWQREKLGNVIEEEQEEIPEAVFQMAVNSISQDQMPLSEAYAEILLRQGKKEKAIEVLEKLSLQNPDKKPFFAAKIDEIKNVY